MNRFLLVSAILFVGGFVNAIGAVWNEQVFHRYAREAERNKGWRISARGSHNLSKQPTPTILFASPQRVTLEQARKLYVEETQKLINRFNSTRAALREPNSQHFSISNMEFAVSFRDSSSRHYCQPYVALVYAIDGRVIYDVLNSDTDTLETIYEESYEEAVWIVQEENQCEYGDF